MTHMLHCPQAFGALRVLSEQVRMQQCSSLAVTDGIRVDVTSAFIAVRLLRVTMSAWDGVVLSGVSPCMVSPTSVKYGASCYTVQSGLVLLCK